MDKEEHKVVIKGQTYIIETFRIEGGENHNKFVYRVDGIESVLTYEECEQALLDGINYIWENRLTQT